MCFILYPAFIFMCSGIVFIFRIIAWVLFGICGENKTHRKTIMPRVTVAPCKVFSLLECMQRWQRQAGKNFRVNCCPVNEQTSLLGGGTPYHGPFREAPPERGSFLRLQVYKRAGISQVEVMKGLGKRNTLTLVKTWIEQTIPFFSLTSLLVMLDVLPFISFILRA